MASNVKNIACDSLSQLPSPADILNQRSTGAPYRVELVVCVLGIAKRTAGPSVLAVTDFTEYLESTALHTVPESLNYATLGRKPVSTYMPFSVNISSYAEKTICEMVGVPHLENATTAQQAVFAWVRLDLKTFNNQAEAQLRKIVPVTAANWRDYATESFRQLGSRYAEYASDKVVARAPFPVERARKRPAAVDFVYRQHETQASQEVERPVRPRAEPPSSQLQTQPQVQSTQWLSDGSSELKSQDLKTQESQKVGPSSQLGYENYLVNTVTLAQLAAVPDTREFIAQRVQFQITGHISVLDPFVVKPFGRTVKVRNLALAVAETPGGRYVRVDFMTEREVCRFFGVSEVEQFYDEAPHQAALAALTGPRKITVTRAVAALNGVCLSYWTSPNSVHDL